MNREHWLTEAVEHMKNQFFTSKYRLPGKIAISCGIPAGSLKAIGQCWSPTVASDGSTHIFICPTLEKPVDVLGVLLHELIHASIGVQHSHNKYFQRVAFGFGLAGKATATVVPQNSALHESLESIADSIGHYPHKAMRKARTVKKVNRPPRVKIVSEKDPSYELSVLLEQLDKGFPVDPWGNTMILKEK